jgi:hypothetical protein
MFTTYIAPAVKEFVDGAMVAFYDVSATQAIEHALENTTQTPTSPVSDATIVTLGEVFSTTPIVTDNITADLQQAATNLTDMQITVPGELDAFLGAYNQALSEGYTSAQAEGIVIAEFVASTLGAQAPNLGLTPFNLTAFQIQQQTAINRADVSGAYADATVTAPNLVPLAIGDAAWVASQNALVGVTNDPATVTTNEARITAAEAANNPALITIIGGPVVPPGAAITDNNDNYYAQWAGLPLGSAPVQGGNEMFATSDGLTLTLSSIAIGLGLSDVYGAGGTINSQLTISGFHTGATGSVINFSVSEWGSGGKGGVTRDAVLGLVEGDATTPVTGGADANFGAGPLSGGGAIGAGTIVVELSGTFTNATALAQYLDSSAGALKFAGALAAYSDAHILFAYSDGTNLHIADVEFFNHTSSTAAYTDGGTTFATPATKGFFVGATDIVEIAGVSSLTAFNSHNIHFLA